MAVPRRFDRQPPERDQTRINERIRVPEVRLIGDDGQQVGIMKTADALRLAQEKDLDLVVVAAEARPPVCRILDYSKYKYEQAQKQKAARKHQQQITIREIKLRPKIAQHDYDTKKGHVVRFLNHRDKVKVTIMFRGREVAHPERGEVLLNRLAEDVAELAVVEQRPTQDGRNMTMMLAPHRSALEGQPDAPAAPAAPKAPKSARPQKPPRGERPAENRPAAERVEETVVSLGEGEGDAPLAVPATAAASPAAVETAPAEPVRVELAEPEAELATVAAVAAPAEVGEAAEAVEEVEPAKATLKPAAKKKAAAKPAAAKAADDKPAAKKAAKKAAAKKPAAKKAAAAKPAAATTEAVADES